MRPPAALTAWARSGAMALTGRPEGPPLPAPGELVEGLLRHQDHLRSLSSALGSPVPVDVLGLLGERAALLGLTRRGDTSCGGATRLMRGSDGWIAISLARPEDVDAVAAWLREPRPPADPWEPINTALEGVSVHDLVERGRAVGLPVSRIGETEVPTPDGQLGVDLPLIAERVAPCAPTRDLSGIRVLDLSSLWAGPLCTHLLQAAGARVVKVESAARPDGARRGPPAFFDLLHAGQQSVALDFGDPAGRRSLHRLARWAEVVVEASRPRALAQLGIDAREVLGEGGTRVWLSITAYGREGAAGQRVGFGDDTAAAAGLVATDESGPCFCADAVADPATGIVGTVAVLAALAAGGRWMLDLSLAGTAAALRGHSGPDIAGGHAASVVGVAPPRARDVVGRGPALGEHTAEVLESLGC